MANHQIYTLAQEKIKDDTTNILIKAHKQNFFIVSTKAPSDCCKLHAIIKSK